MRFGIVCVLFSLVVVVQCNDLAWLNDLKSLDFLQIFRQLLADKGTDFDKVTQSQLTGRNYDWDMCVNEFGTIFDGLNRTEWWAMQCKYIISSFTVFLSECSTNRFRDRNLKSEALWFQENTHTQLHLNSSKY